MICLLQPEAFAALKFSTRHILICNVYFVAELYGIKKNHSLLALNLK